MTDVALIITSFNHGHFLADALESGLQQVHPFREIVVVDDGSTDDTASVAARFPQARYVRQENRGLAAARNSGLRLSTSNFLIFLDADDRLLPNAVEAGLRCLEANPAAQFAYGGFRYIQPTGEISSEVPVTECGPDPYLALLRCNFVSMHATVMYRRHALIEVKGFQEQLRACEDYDIYLRIAREAKIACHATIVADYRRHGHNMSRDARLMLDTSLAVLRSQRVHVQGDRARRAAYKQGVRGWQALYGTQWARQIAARSRSGVKLHKLAGEICALAVRAPYALLANQRWAYRAIRRKTLARLPFRLGARLLARVEPERPPPPGMVSLGDLRRLEPISRDFGFDRGTPVDRYYVERFLAAQTADIRGRVLEVGDNVYTRRFGSDRVLVSDVLNVNPGGASTTIVADLSSGTNIPDDTFDCVIVTQTLHLLWDVAGGVRTLLRILKPGGALLLTVPGTISQLERGQWSKTWYWGFAPLAIQRLFAEIFGPPNVSINVYGNVLASTAFLQGLAAEELRRVELDRQDPQYPLLITVRATKAVTASRPELAP
jgi:glycosyltransferase involved in cell wall biosynthesis